MFTDMSRHQWILAETSYDWGKNQKPRLHVNESLLYNMLWVFAFDFFLEKTHTKGDQFNLVQWEFFYLSKLMPDKLLCIIHVPK